jgi:hypothetical protein
MANADYDFNTIKVNPLWSWIASDLWSSFPGKWARRADGFHRVKDALPALFPNLRFTSQSSTAVTRLFTNCYSFVRHFRVKSLSRACLTWEHISTSYQEMEPMPSSFSSIKNESKSWISSCRLTNVCGPMQTVRTKRKQIFYHFKDDKCSIIKDGKIIARATDRRH